MIDPSWGMAVGGMGVGFGFFMLRGAAVVWTNAKKGNGKKDNDKYVEIVEYKATSSAIFTRLGAVEKRTDEIYKLLLEGRR